MTDRYLTVQQDILETFVDRGQLRPERVEVRHDAVIEPVEVMTRPVREPGVRDDGQEQAGRERRVDALEESEEQDADPVAQPGGFGPLGAPSA